MKKLLIVALLLGTLGCAKKVVAPVPGQLNTFDAYAFRVLADAQAAIGAFRADVASGKVTASPAIKTALNQAISDYDIANATYQAWHAAGGSGSTTAIAATLTAVQTDITTIAGAK